MCDKTLPLCSWFKNDVGNWVRVWGNGSPAAIVLCEHSGDVVDWVIYDIDGQQVTEGTVRGRRINMIPEVQGICDLILKEVPS